MLTNAMASRMMGYNDEVAQTGMLLGMEGIRRSNGNDKRRGGWSIGLEHGFNPNARLHMKGSGRVHDKNAGASVKLAGNEIGHTGIPQMLRIEQVRRARPMGGHSFDSLQERILIQF